MLLHTKKKKIAKEVKESKVLLLPQMTLQATKVRAENVDKKVETEKAKKLWKKPADNEEFNDRLELGDIFTILT